MIHPVLADFGLRFVFIVLLLSGLCFLGLGVQPPNADLGSLVRENIGGLADGAPAVLMPALAIATLTIGVNLLIDELPSDGAAWSAMRARRRPRPAASRCAACASSRPAAGETIVDAASASTIPRGEVLALIGESGSGKTTIALRSWATPAPAAASPAARSASAAPTCSTLRRPPALRGLRGTAVAYVAQSAAAAFNPGAHDLMRPGDRAGAASTA